MVAVVSKENMASLVSRNGRHSQRYSKGYRQVVGFLSLSLLLRISDCFYCQLFLASHCSWTAKHGAAAST